MSRTTRTRLARWTAAPFAALAAITLAATVAPSATAAPPGPDKIVGGQQAPEGRYTEAVKLRITDGSSIFGCGATVISPDTILTAQHCLDKAPGGFTKVEAYIGKVDWRQGEVRTVTTWRTGGGPRYGDWAVAKLSSPTTVAGRALLPADASLDTSSWFSAIGWGRLVEGGAGTNYLQEIDLPLHTGDGCLPYRDAEICASGNGTAGKDTCNGDSGGPLYATRNGIRYQVGITSWGVGCARASSPGHYTKISAYRSQILSAIDAIGGTRPGGTTPTPDPDPEEPTPIPSGNTLVNPGFESGFTAWTGTSGPITNSVNRPARTGTWKLWLGGNGTSSTETVRQTAKVPASGKLSYYLRVDSAESTAYTRYDTMTVSVTVDGTSRTLATYSNLDKSTLSSYTKKTHDLSAYAGKNATVTFTMREDSYAQTSFVVDDTSLAG